jgi:diguanylate cyclase (GGDEF)-like protein
MTRGCDNLSAPSRLEAITSRISGFPKATKIIFCIVLLLCVAALDDVTGSEVSFSLFYLVPVLTAALFVSRRAGEAFAVASAITWGILEVSAREYSAAWIPVWNSAVRLGFLVLVVELVAATKQSQLRQNELARTDPLTGIANARVFREAVESALSHSRRSGDPFSVAYIDLDRFKHVNDTYGHSEGDKVLRFVATNMQAVLRKTDTLARLGGDEFAIIFTSYGDNEPTSALDRIRSTIELSLEERWCVGMTVGLVTFIDPPSDSDAVVHAADSLMYKGKSEGKGIVVHDTWSAS